MTQKLTIDPEIKSLCPSLSDEEKKTLEDMIVAEGCRDPILVWANHNDIIIDGEHRYEICTAHRLPFKTKAMTFASKSDVVVFVLKNQLGRRNLTDANRTFALGRLYKELKLPRGGDRAKPHSAVLLSADEIAAKQGVSADTLQRAEAFADAVDAIAEQQGAEAKAEILAGKSKLGKAKVVKASKLPKAQQAKALKTGKLPEAPKQGAQKKDPRLWVEVEALFGKAINRTDELHRQFQHGNLHRALIAQTKTCMATLAEWKQASK